MEALKHRPVGPSVVDVDASCPEEVSSEQEELALAVDLSAYDSVDEVHVHVQGVFRKLAHVMPELTAERLSSDRERFCQEAEVAERLCVRTDALLVALRQRARNECAPPPRSLRVFFWFLGFVLASSRRLRMAWYHQRCRLKAIEEAAHSYEALIRRYRVQISRTLHARALNRQVLILAYSKDYAAKKHALNFHKTELVNAESYEKAQRIREQIRQIKELMADLETQALAQAMEESEYRQ